jgi:WD40 repeat protein
VALSADGRALASGNRNGIVGLWDLQRAESPVQALSGHSAGVRTVAFSPDGRQLATGSEDAQNAVKLWDLSSGRAALLRTLPECTAPVAFSPDGATLAAGTHDHEHVQIRTASAGTLLHTLTVPQGPVAVAFSSDGKLVAIGSGTADWGDVSLWDARTGAALRTLASSAGYVTSVGFSPDGRNIAAGSDERWVKLWDVQTGRLLRTLVGHDSGVIAVGFFAEGRILASGDGEHAIKVWDVGSGRLLATLLLLPPDRQGEVGGEWISFTPEGYYTASPGANRFIRSRVGGRPGEPVRLFPAEAHEAALRRPDLVERALRGEMLPPN